MQAARALGLPVSYGVGYAPGLGMRRDYTVELFRRKNFAFSAGMTDHKEPLALVGYYRTLHKKLGIDIGARVGVLGDLQNKRLKPYAGVGLRMKF